MVYLHYQYDRFLDDALDDCAGVGVGGIVATVFGRRGDVVAVVGQVVG